MVKTSKKLVKMTKYITVKDKNRLEKLRLDAAKSTKKQLAWERKHDIWLKSSKARGRVVVTFGIIFVLWYLLSRSITGKTLISDMLSIPQFFSSFTETPTRKEIFRLLK